MTWPTAATKTHSDSSTDDPKQMRAELADLVDQFNALRSHFSSFMQTFASRSTAALARTDLELATVGQSEAEAGTGTTTRAWTAQRVAQAIAALAPNAAAVNVRLLFLQVAELTGGVLNLANGIADPFETESNVDNSASTNEVHRDGYYQGLTSSDANALQDAKTGSNSTTMNASRPFAGIRWTQSGDTVAIGATIDIHAVGTSGNATMRLFEAGNSTPIVQSNTVAISTTGEVDFTFANPIDLSDSTDYVLELIRSSGEYTFSTVTAPGSDVTYSAVQGSSVYNISSDAGMDASEDLRMGLVVGSTANLTLVSEAATAVSVPSTATLSVQVKENEAITVNTDLTGEVSRDDGTTWTAGTLVLAATLADGTKVYEAVDFDISGQPSGTSMRRRIKTLNTKDIEIHGAVGEWSS